jgi:16S rRNA (adenine1518-N6/adenine1519-N6)-dimethyltransferase
MKDEQRFKNKSRKPKIGFAKKSFGQNFLIDENYISKIVSALKPQTGETIIEIGAGRGALTKNLIKSGASIVAIELDRDLIPILEDEFGQNENFALAAEDALRVDFKKLSERFNSQSKIQNSKSIKLVANLPYNISTAILQRLIEQRDVFSEMILMFQLEVVERITAEAGTSERGFLSVLVQAYLDAEKLFDVPPDAFRPAPKVWSSVVRLKPKKAVDIENVELFREIISAGFAQRRKTILNNLKNAPENLRKKYDSAESVLETARIDAKRRAETLTVDEWKQILEAVS